MFRRIGSFAYRNRGLVIAVWSVVLVAGLAATGVLFGRLHADVGGSPRAESVRAFERLHDLAPSAGDLVALLDDVPIDDPEIAEAISVAARDISRMNGVLAVTDYFTTKAPPLAAADRQATLVIVRFRDGLPEEALDTAIASASGRLRAIHQARVTLGGELLVQREWPERSERDLQRGESIALPIALLVMGVLLGGFVAGLLPVAVALASVSGALLLLLGASSMTDVSTFAVNVVTMFGLGLAIDYGLLVVNRFKEERAAGASVEQAVERTTATAGVTITFSALTVAAALAGLFAFRDPTFRSLALGGIGVVLVAMAAGVTLLPALLGVAGDAVKPAKPRATDHGYFFRLSHLVMRRPGLVVGLVSALLVLAGLPFLHARFESADVRTFPRTSDTRRVYETVVARFPGQAGEPVVVLAETPRGGEAAAALVGKLSALPGVTAATPRLDVPPSVTVVDVRPAGATQSDLAQGLVRSIRALDSPYDVSVTGQAAFLIDQKREMAAGLPWAILIIVLATFVLLFLMTGSVVVPAKAIVMNVLSLGATLGALVWGFQDGHLAGLMNFDPTGAIDVMVPVLLFVFAFGLSMDYEVFLLSRIKEIHDEGIDNDHAVALGLQRTGRIITSAALLIVIVFAGFAFGEMLFIKQMGFGMAVAVIVDATVVRSLLVPATMKLMGEWNWWAPAPLRRLHDRIGLHEPAPAAAPVPTPVP